MSGPALVRGELVKVLSTRLWLGMLIGVVAFTALQVVAQIFGSGQQPGSAGITSDAGVRNVYSSAGASYVLVLVLGILGMTQEFRHMTVTSTFLAEPRRIHVVIAKMFAHALIGAAFALVALSIGFGLSAVLLGTKEHAPIASSTLWQIAGGVILGFVLYTVLGVAFGALVRNQIAAILIAIVWVLLIEALVVAFLPAVGKWLPGGAMNGLLQATGFNNATYLAPLAAAALLLAYCLGLAAIAAATTLRSDIT